MNKELLLATKNQGKVKELKKMLKDLPVEIKSIEDCKNIPEDFDVQETGRTFKKNATLKAEAFGKLTNILTIADDSGLEIDALGGKPGVRSARFIKGSDLDRNFEILKLMKNIPSNRRSAKFITVVALFNPELNETKTFKGLTKGKIVKKIKGTRGFGYDPIFFSNDLAKTFGEVTREEKNQVSHRARALRKAKVFLIKRLQETTK